MRNAFPGHFPEHVQTINRIWSNALIAVDANFLLNLYRYSNKTRDEILTLLQQQRARLWLPHRAAEEYLANRLSVLEKQQNEYDETIKSIDDLRRRLDNRRSHPFISEDLTKEVSSLFDRLKQELSEHKDRHETRISDDAVKDCLGTLFLDRTGEPFSTDELTKLFEDGEQRYRQKTPPGYKDAAKAGEDNEDFFSLCRKYGDLILWKQLIRKASTDQIDLLFVTDDRKEDWWSQSRGKTLGPRPELLSEFYRESGQAIQIYQVDRFLELADQQFSQTVSSTSVDEIRSLQEFDRAVKEKKLKRKRRAPPTTRHRRSASTNSLQNEIDRLNSRLNRASKELQSIQDERDYIINNSEDFGDDSFVNEILEDLNMRQRNVINKALVIQSERDAYIAKLRPYALEDAGFKGSDEHSEGHFDKYFSNSEESDGNPDQEWR